MQLREFAERVLFADSLELKLADPGVLVDNQPGTALNTPSRPGRPQELVFGSGPSQRSLPRAHELENEGVRGQLLHFFANHELLATELMALVLLKFPDAPKAFRRGVLKTLRDEQEHTRIYIERLQQLGVEFGQHPVNGFFWKVIAPMETPLAYVSRLALTFEQANLDYSLHFAHQFQTIGDTPSQTILERIHRDEIGHVGYGLKWFRRWKDPNLSDWEAFEKQLEFPLSPSRAKAAPFNVDARRRAGFSEAFIQELLVYSKSRGRTPGVFLFNPLAEAHMTGTGPFHPNRHETALASDLAHLPQFICGIDDVLLVPERPRTMFLTELKQAGFEPPQVEVLDQGRLRSDSELLRRKIGRLQPWAWSPDSIEVLRPLMPQLTSTPLAEGTAWETHLRPLFAKSWSASLLRTFLDANGGPDWLCPVEDTGVAVASFDDALTTLEGIRQRGHHRCVAKQLFGSAGQQMLRLWEPELTEAQRIWIRRSLDQHETLIIEPWLDRVLDFSIQFDMKPAGLRQLGIVRLINDRRGQFKASLWTPRWTHGLNRELAAWIHRDTEGGFDTLFESLRVLLGSRLKEAGYLGPLGVDAFIYRDSNRRLRLKPVVEINPRFTMGRVLLEIMRKHVKPGRCGRLDLVSTALLRRAGWATFNSLVQQLREQDPVRLEGTPKLRITGGTVCLSDAETAQGVIAVLRVDNSPPNDLFARP